jgi:ABC-2 type transport system ATP-binding protein
MMSDLSAKPNHGSRSTSAAEMPYAIEVQNIVKKYGDFTAVDHVSFHVKEGEIFGLLGPLQAEP